jgi:hypothetical protein
MTLGPRTFLIAIVGVIAAACWILAFAVHGLPGVDWMNWKGWGWIFSPVNLAIGISYGWMIRGHHEQNLRWREERERAANAPGAAGPGP